MPVSVWHASLCKESGHQITNVAHHPKVQVTHRGSRRDLPSESEEISMTSFASRRGEFGSENGKGTGESGGSSTSDEAMDIRDGGLLKTSRPYQQSIPMDGEEY
jgi:hypothetical protein